MWPSLPNPTTCRGWPHHQVLRPLLFSNSSVGSFTSHKNRSVKVLWDGTYGVSSLSEKTRKSNHLQMSLQRQHFLLSYLKTLSVGPAGVWIRDPPLSGPALSQLSLPGGGFVMLLMAARETSVVLIFGWNIGCLEVIIKLLMTVLRAPSPVSSHFYANKWTSRKKIAI